MTHRSVVIKADTDYLLTEEQTLLFVTNKKNKYYIELVSIFKDFNVIFEFGIEILQGLTLQDKDEVNSGNTSLTLLFQGPKSFKLIFQNTSKFNHLFCFVWSVIRLLNYTFSNSLSNLALNNLDLKVLNEIAGQQDYYRIHPVFQSEKESIHASTLTSKESDLLEEVFKNLNLGAITNYDLEVLTAKLENYSIETKEKFITNIQSNFSKESSAFSLKVNGISTLIKNVEGSLYDDNQTMNNLFQQIQKIEEINHKEEIRCVNLQRLMQLIKEIYSDMSPGNEQSLLKSEYKSKSELLIVKTAMSRFVEFFAKRQKTNYNLDIIQESEIRITKTLSKIIDNFSKATRQNITDSRFKEMNLIKSMDELKYLKQYCQAKTTTVKQEGGFDPSEVIRKLANAYNSIKYRKLTLFRFFKERRFFINSLLSIYKSNVCVTIEKGLVECETQICKAIRDLLVKETNSLIFIWEAFYESEIFNTEKLNIYLDKDDLLQFDFQSSEKNDLHEMSSEYGKFIASLLINLFFALDISIDSLNYFFESSKQVLGPSLNSTINNSTNNSSNMSRRGTITITSKTHESVLTQSILLITESIFPKITSYINNSVEKNILMGFVIFTILLSIKTQIQKNIVGDVVILKMNDIIESSKQGVIQENEDSIFASNLKEDAGGLFGSSTDRQEENNIVIQDLASRADMNKISLQETKDLIEYNFNNLTKQVKGFFAEQKLVFQGYKIEIRYVGIVPLCKKTLNFLNILISLTGQIKQDFTFELVEEFCKLMKEMLETLTKDKEKYTNIVLAENYYFIYKFLNDIEEKGYVHPILEKLMKEILDLYNYRKELYIQENFANYFAGFIKFYGDFKIQYNNLKSSNNLQLLKMQNNLTFDKVDKNVNAFLKSLNSNIKEIAERIHKHFSKENLLVTIMYTHTKYYIKEILTVLDEAYKSGYGKILDENLVKSIFSKMDSINITSDFKKK